MSRFLQTKQDSLVVALTYIEGLGVSRGRLVNDFGLRPNTLSDISNGKVLIRGREKYLTAFIKELELLRLDAVRRERFDEAGHIIEITYSVILVDNGIASLAEQQEENTKVEKQNFMRQFR